jgi:hypothetical protein
MNHINLFPTLIGSHNYAEKDAFKEKVFRTFKNHVSPQGYSNENTGHLDLHHEKAYEDFFKFVTACARDHVSGLNIDPSIYDFNIVKAWFNISKTKNNPKHNHSDAHLSFVYYIHTPAEYKKMLCFFLDNNPNALYAGMLDRASSYTLANAVSWAFETDEGTMYTFPAKIPHAVVASAQDVTNIGILNVDQLDEPIKELKTFRVAIAGDIVLTHNEKALVNLGLQPISNWRTF